MHFKERVCVPVDDELRRMILENGHKSHCSMRLCIFKMYKNLKEFFWWSRMKKDVIEFVTNYYYKKNNF